jgi:hypothetical protein
LEKVEHDVQRAAAEARTAATLAATGRLREALEHAGRACDLEARYHRQLTWQALRDALEASDRHRDEVRAQAWPGETTQE